MIDVARVALLAELRLEPGEEEKLAREMDAILAYVAELEKLDTKDVPPTTSVLPTPGGEEAWRVDEIVPGLSHEDALRGAPRAEHEGFGVPAVIE